MSRVNVESEIMIERPREVVASYAADPDRATSWYRNIKSVRWESPKPLGLGTRIAFEARFLGRTIAYTYEIREWIEGERLVMGTSDGPLVMETTYLWSDAADGGTRMTLRNRGQASGFSALGAPLLAMAMRRANSEDLARLKAILESSREG